MNATKLKIIFLGDLFGEPGRRAVGQILPELKIKFTPDLVFANCENAANGRGISRKIANELEAFGFDLITTGNHVYQVKDIYPYLNEEGCKIIRPYNFPRNSPGRGVAVVSAPSGLRVGVINLMGNLFMQTNVDCPFHAIDSALSELKDETDIVLVDFHAEATSEKRAMGWYLDGKVQLCVGTHTHILTADDEILPGGTAYITDIGMCGPHDSVIGMDKEIIINKYRTLIPRRFEVAKNDLRVTGIYCEIDLENKKATKINRIDERVS